MSNIFNDEFRDFLNALNDQKVRYILVGGYSNIKIDLKKNPLVPPGQSFFLHLEIKCRTYGIVNPGRPVTATGNTGPAHAG